MAEMSGKGVIFINKTFCAVYTGCLEAFKVPTCWEDIAHMKRFKYKRSQRQEQMWKSEDNYFCSGSSFLKIRQISPCFPFLSMAEKGKCLSIFLANSKCQSSNLFNSILPGFESALKGSTVCQL